MRFHFRWSLGGGDWEMEIRLRGNVGKFPVCLRAHRGRSVITLWPAAPVWSTQPAHYVSSAPGPSSARPSAGGRGEDQNDHPSGRESTAKSESVPRRQLQRAPETAAAGTPGRQAVATAGRRTDRVDLNFKVSRAFGQRFKLLAINAEPKGVELLQRVIDTYERVEKNNESTHGVER